MCFIKHWEDVVKQLDLFRAKNLPAPLRKKIGHTGARFFDPGVANRSVAQVVVCSSSKQTGREVAADFETHNSILGAFRDMQTGDGSPVAGERSDRNQALGKYGLRSSCLGCVERVCGRRGASNEGPRSHPALSVRDACGENGHPHVRRGTRLQSRPAMMAPEPIEDVRGAVTKRIGKAPAGGIPSPPVNGPRTCVEVADVWRTR